MNGVYIRKMPLESFIEEAKARVIKAGLNWDESKFRIVAPLIQERLKTFTEIAPQVEFLFKDTIERDLEAMYGKGIDAAVAKTVLEKVLAGVSAVPEFSHDSLEPVLKGVAEELKLKAGPMYGVVRIAVTGKKNTPPLFESLAALGKEKTVERIQQTMALL